MTSRIKKPCVAILILGYNHAETVMDTLSCALQQSYESYEVIYIDNASQDDSLLRVRKKFPHLRVIQHKKNLGYAGAYKQVLKIVFSERFDMAVLLNPDTHFESNWLKPLVRSAEKHPDTALVQSKVYLWDGGKTTLFNTAGNNIHFLGIGFCGRYKEPDTPPIQEDSRIPYASGASLLVKKEAYEKLPGLDEDFFAYLEDQDLGWQANMFGYTNILCAQSIVWHRYDFQKKSLSGLKMYLLERNRFAFLLKNFEWKTLLLIAPALIVFEGGILFHSLLQGYFFKKLLAYKDFFTRIPSILKKRKIVQAKRTMSDRELFFLLSPTIEFEEVRSPLLSVVNRFLNRYHKIINHWL